jgi:ribosomal protein S18 acetylase RimI-like enzyme
VTTKKARGLVATSALSDAELRDVRRLAVLCNAHEGLSLKLNLAPAAPGASPTKFLYYADGVLVGYAALFPASIEAELCGMVHPQYRRRGIGRELLEAAVAACQRDALVHLLLVVEDASRSGQGFVHAIGGLRDFAELHLEMESRAVKAPKRSRLAIREADIRDAQGIARVVASAFGGDVERVTSRVVGELQERGARHYAGELNGQVIATLKVYLSSESAGIYAFGVLPEYRDAGYGREMLTGVIQQMRAEGRGRVYLEVDIDNDRARHLYRSVGFAEVTTYVYYTVPFIL